jgi:hypothetical protein
MSVGIQATCQQFFEDSDLMKSGDNIFLTASGTSPRSWPCRLIYLTTYVTFMVLFMAYCATFISHLTVRRRELPFRDFQGFLNDGTYKLGAVYGSAHEAYLKVRYIYIHHYRRLQNVCKHWSCTLTFLRCYWSPIVKTLRASFSRLVSYNWTRDDWSIQNLYTGNAQVLLAHWLSPRSLIFCIYNCRIIVK